MRRQRGFTMFDALIALALLSFGLLGLSRLQTHSLAQATENQSRLTAMQFGDELLSQAMVDGGNHDCYTLPAAGSCGYAPARANTTDWNTRLVAAIPSATATSTYDSTNGRMKVSITWTGKAYGETRTYEATTDVR